jgi:hypothetical protein
LEENELRDLQERAHLIREMTRTPAWELLRDYCSTVVDAKTRNLLSGHAATVEEYRADAGFVSGARFVLEAGDRLEQQLQLAMQWEAEYKAAEAV